MEDWQRNFENEDINKEGNELLQVNRVDVPLLTYSFDNSESSDKGHDSDNTYNGVPVMVPKEEDNNSESVDNED